MKTFLLLVFVALLALIVVNRRRIYVRDPLATVYKSDARQDGKFDARQDGKSDLRQGGRNGVKQSGVQVFINYSNDVLLWQDAEPGAYRILLQAWNKAPGSPVRLTCLRWVVCLADADRASIYPIDWTGNNGRGKGKYDPRVSMTSRTVSFVDGDGATMRVELR
jgi:hypothetical protein